MKRLMMGTVVAALMALCQLAQANVIIATNTVSFEGVSGGVAQPSDYLYITYDVNEISAGLYEYDYDLSTIAPEDLSSFTIGGVTDPIDTASMAISNYGSASVSGSGFDNNSVGWIWGFNSGVTSDDLSFTSTNAPGYATFTANDHDIEWESGSLIPAPIPLAPVPEPSSLALAVAASAMVYCLFKYRRTPKFAVKKVKRISRVSATRGGRSS